MMRQTLGVALLSTSLLAPTPSHAAEDGPWRAHEALGAPDWLRFGLAHRQRYSYLADGFHSARPGDGGIVNLRSHATLELRPQWFRLGLELLDSRAYVHKTATAPNTGIVNGLALLRAHAGAEVALGDELVLRASAGRMTIDVGSRRLVARNGFRNTINNFTGVDLALEDGAHQLRVFATLPVRRLPDVAEDVADNRIVFDRESFDVVFAGQFGSLPLGESLSLEGYLLELVERDGEERATRNRRLLTPGARILRKPSVGSWDLELESALQVGKSRASGADDDTEDLSHLALFQHASFGYTLDVWARPRLVAQYDFASGDGDPRDDSNNRFDTLFGGRRFELGPTGVYGALARSNLRSPGGRIEIAPHETVTSFVGWRAAWLASARDSWTTASRRDGDGASGTFIGHQLEVRFRYTPWRGNLRLEAGAAHLFPGHFVRNVSAPDAAPATTMVYSQISGSI
jgi:Alginate export